MVNEGSSERMMSWPVKVGVGYLTVGMSEWVGTAGRGAAWGFAQCPSVQSLPVGA